MSNRPTTENAARKLGAQPSLLDHEQLFRLMVENVRDYAIFMLDPTGHVATWNRGAEQINGYRAEEIIGQHFSVFYPASDIEAGKCEMELEVAEREGRFEDLGWRLRKDGTRFWANVVITAVRDPERNLIGFAKVTRDLTDRKRAEEEAIARLEAEERFRLIIESVRDYAIFMLDAGGHVATWNIGAERIHGYRAEEIIGSHFSRFYPQEDVEAGKCEMELRAAAQDGRFEDEDWRVRKDGSRFWANVVISAVRDHEGRLIGYSKVTRDLTERRVAEADRTARLAAEHASRTKDEFLAILGHELRNPLAPILTALQLLKLRGQDPPPKEHAVIERQVRHMMHLVDDLLDISRITRGKLELRRHPIDLRGVVAKAIELASPLIEQRGHRLQVDLPTRPIGVDVDEARMTQVLANLMTNAAKYTEPGGAIRVSVTERAGDVDIAVSDNGIGIPPDLLPRVFDLFVQGYRTSERSGGGLGIGLTLVRNLVEMHGGTVSAHSEGVGRGSRFTVHLPVVALDVTDNTHRAPKLFAVARSRRILVVDDNEDARELLAEALRAAGHDVYTAGDPAQALNMIEAVQPEVAILDIGLPVMDGYELAGRIRSQLAGELHLFALTGYGQASDRERAHAAGFAAHFVKPVDLKLLIDSIEAL
ncbi:MAG TPA: PAS domain S-box protein [Kofleriaceae bacterium]|nr:PAS domain S-box protein [Kofleriaceae bacterium]